MNDKIAGVVRHALTSLGGALVAGGYLTSDEWTTIAGGVGIVIGIIWSIIAKRFTNISGIGNGSPRMGP